MLDRVTTNGPRGLGEEANVVTALCAFLEAGLVHLGVGEAARRSAEDLAARIAGRTGDGGSLVLEVADGELLCDGRTLSGAEEAEGWLVHALERCRARGVRFHGHVDADALLDFANAVRVSSEADASALGEVWDGTCIAVLSLVDGPRRHLADTRSMMQRLARSDAARSALGQLHAAIELEYAGAARLDSFDMLTAILEKLPGSVLADDDRTCVAIETVLDGMISQLQGFLAARPEDPAERMSRMAARLAEERFSDQRNDQTSPRQREPEAEPFSFGIPGLEVPVGESPRSASAPTLSLRRAEPQDSRDSDLFEPAPVPSEPAVVSGHETPPAEIHDAAPVDPLLMMDPRRVADDISALRDELSRLPPAHDLRLEDHASQLDDEVLGTCLHLLTHARDPERVEQFVAPIVDGMLADPKPTQRRTLGRYLRLARERGGAKGDPVAVRLVAFLQHRGVDKLMTTRETVDVEQVIQTFPAQFLIWLDALELRDPASQRQFQRLCDAVGSTALAEIARVLIDDGTLLTPNRTEKILKFGGARVAQIARMLVETEASWTRQQIVNYLRRQDLPPSLSAALAVIQPIAQLPTPYLADLCRCIERGRTPTKIHGYTSLLLRHYVRDTAERSEHLDRRLYAIRALAHWPSPENVQYLQELARSGRFVNPSKEARAVRQAAAETLARIREAKRQG